MEKIIIIVELILLYLTHRESVRDKARVIVIVLLGILVAVCVILLFTHKHGYAAVGVILIFLAAFVSINSKKLN